MQVQRFDFREFTSSEVTLNADKPQLPFRKVSRAPEAAPAPVQAPPPPPEPVAPTFSEDDLKAAELKGYQRGFTEGMEDGKRQADAETIERKTKLQEHVEKFATSMQPLFAEYRSMMLDMRAQIAPMALAIARKVAGPALQDNAEKIIEATVLSACESMFTEPKLSITVHESMGDMLAKQLEVLANKLQAATDIVILRDPDMPASDCKVEWKNGIIERNTDAIWQQLEKAAGNITVGEMRDTNEKLDTLGSSLASSLDIPSPTEPTPTEHKE